MRKSKKVLDVHNEQYKNNLIDLLSIVECALSSNEEWQCDVISKQEFEDKWSNTDPNKHQYDMVWDLPNGNVMVKYPTK